MTSTTEPIAEAASAQQDLPASWAFVTLGEVGTVTSGATPSTGDESNFGEDVPWVTPADLTGYTARYISSGRRSLSRKGYESCSATLIPEGSLLFSSRAPIGYVAIAANPIATNQGFKNLTPFTDVHPEYVYYYLKSAKQVAEKSASGTTFLELSAKAFAMLPFPLPPLPEQERIVARLEELFSRLDAGVDTLKRTQALLKRYRQSVLRAAVTGELTREWREQHGFGNPNWEPAERLLERILTERRARWEQSGKKGKYAEPEAPDVTGLPELPQGWTWATLQALGTIKGGLTKDSKKTYEYSRELPYLRVANVQRGYLDLTEMKTITVPLEKLDELLLAVGDILFNEGGDRDKLGRGWVWEGQLDECTFQNHVFRMRSYVKDLNSKFISYYANSYGQAYFLKVGNQTTNLASINLTMLSQLPVPLAPLDEQAVIVEEVERRLSIIDGMEATLTAEVRRAESLRQSILHRAFTGQLVSQDPNDEPASELLKRIQAEREAAGGVKRGRGVGKATPTGAQEGCGRPRKTQGEEIPTPTNPTGDKRGRGRPRKADQTPDASSVEEAIRMIEARKAERAEGKRMVGLWEEGN